MVHKVRLYWFHYYRMGKALAMQVWGSELGFLETKQNYMR